ncbi:MAG: protein kinase [Polyangiaceae bacterium]|nr:protein kinase [Polyangiaceae bacterium]
MTLLDFGIAQVNLKQGGVTREQTIVGTNGYMSPEQLRSDRLDGRSDLFAVGVVLYEMLCGHPPYVPDPKNVPSLPELLVKTLSGPFPISASSCRTFPMMFGSSSACFSRRTATNGTPPPKPRSQSPGRFANSTATRRSSFATRWTTSSKPWKA